MKNTVKDYFLKMTDRVSFVEMKETAVLKIKDYTLKRGLPLPILTDTLLEEIKQGNLYDNFNISHITEGMVYILGIDTEFKYNEEYKKILYKINSKIEDFILYLGLKYDEEGKLDDSAILFRSLINLNRKNIKGLFNYAIQLEKIAKKLIESEKDEEGNAFLQESTSIFEEILDLEPDYPLVYYKLGYHYKNFGQFLKAKLMWKKYLKFNDNQLRLQEIRDELEIISDDADYEEGINYFSKGKYTLALDKFTSLLQKHKKNWNLYYMTGIAYKLLGEYEKAIDNFIEGINLGGESADLYNELGICFFQIGNVNKSIDILTKGIEVNNDNYKLFYNRGLIYLRIGLFEKAKKDLEAAYKLNPEDVVLKDTLEKIKGNY